MINSDCVIREQCKDHVAYLMWKNAEMLELNFSNGKISLLILVNVLKLR